MDRADSVTACERTDRASDVAERMAQAHAAAGRGDYPAALAIWGPLAHAGVGRAQNNIGACFAEGLGVDRDHRLALRWLTLAAETGDTVARRNLAALYFKGEGVEQDNARAAELFWAGAGGRGGGAARRVGGGRAWGAGRSGEARRRASPRGGRSARPRARGGMAHPRPLWWKQTRGAISQG